jgi:pimeloyl-ACP methyl ester carboxylesterase
MPYAKVNSKLLFYALTPPASSSPLPLTLLFIHGLGSSSSFYAPILPHFTASGYRCLTLDTHGSGSSAYTGSGNSIGSIASDIDKLLDKLDITENIVVVGHSMGGIVASHLVAGDSKRRFKAAVLIGPVDPNPSAAEVFRKRIGVVEKGRRLSIWPIPLRPLASNPYV